MNKQEKFAGWHFTTRCTCVFVLQLVTVIGAGSPVAAQSDNTSATKPYATLDRQAVTYRGPVGSAEKDAFGDSDVIGAMLPLQGPQQAEGQALLAALQMALEQEQARGDLPGGRKLVLTVRDDSGPWGQASTEILKLIDNDHALVLLTSANGNIAHQAEQIANKISFPILTLASDPTTTETNVPWLFRLGPSDAEQARAFAQRIYTELQLRSVLLVAQTDHDGRIGRGEFEKAAREIKASPPEVLELSPAGLNPDTVAAVIQTKAPDALVIWSDAETAQQALLAIRKTKPMIPVFLSTKAAQLGTLSPNAGLCITALLDEQNLGDTFTLVSSPVDTNAAREAFERAYHAKTGTPPGLAALEAYQAVHWLTAALRAAGANRILLRDYLANDGKFHRQAALVPFDPAGNNTEEFAVTTIVMPPVQTAAH